MTETQYGYMFTMTAKPGRGGELRAAMAKANAGSTDVQGWLVGTADDDADSLIGFEFFENETLATRHDHDPDVQKTQAQVAALLAGPPSRTVIRPTATNLQPS
jgi:quinol monooxygenase YgiN